MKSRLLTYLAIATLGVTLAACGKQSTDNANEIIVKIGSVAPVTGPQTRLKTCNCQRSVHDSRTFSNRR